VCDCLDYEKWILEIMIKVTTTFSLKTRFKIAFLFSNIERTNFTVLCVTSLFGLLKVQNLMVKIGRQIKFTTVGSYLKSIYN